jgi:hypothetical protein
MNQPIHTESYKGYSIEVFYDELSSLECNPCEYAKLGKVYTWHRRYSIGDPHNFRDTKEMEDAILEEAGKLNAKNRSKALNELIFVIMPVYMYDHGGRVLSTSPFDCPWDSGQLGWTYVTTKAAKEWFNVSKLKPEHKVKARELLEKELKLLNNWIEGEIYYFDIKNPDGKIETDVSGIGGYFGADFDDMIEEAKKEIDGIVNKKLEDAKYSAASKV